MAAVEGECRQGPASVRCTQHCPLPARWQVPARHRSHRLRSGRDRLRGKLRQWWECRDLSEPFWKGTQQPCLLPGHWFAALGAAWSQAGADRVWLWAWKPGRGWCSNPPKPHWDPLCTTLCRGKGSASGSGVPGSPLRGRCMAELGSLALSGPSKEEVCRVDSSRQVNSDQMGPRYLPRDTRQAGFAQLRCLFALGRAFPSVGRQQRCQDVTPAALPGSSVTLLARCLHPGCCCGPVGLGGCAAQSVTDPQPHFPQPGTSRRPGLLRHGQKGWGLQVPSSAELGGPWPRWTPLQWARGEGLLLTALAQCLGVQRWLAEDARCALAHMREHRTPSPGLQRHRDAPGPGCKILSWLIQLGQLTLLPPHPAAFPAPRGKLRHGDGRIDAGT